MKNAFKNLFGGKSEDSETKADAAEANVPKVDDSKCEEDQAASVSDNVDNVINSCENQIKQVMGRKIKTDFRSKVRGNDYCPCGSNKKLKKCCGLDEKKLKDFSKTINVSLLNEKAKKEISRLKKIEEKLKKKPVAEVKKEQVVKENV